MFATKEAYGRVSPHDAAVFELMAKVVRFMVIVYERLPQSEREVAWPNCHSMARALKVVFADRVTVVDGRMAGSSHYGVSRDDTVSLLNYGKHIEHSWLRLRDGALVDVFPAGVYAFSPLLYPPHGMFHDVFPANVYLEDEDGIPEYLNGAKLEYAWQRAGRIACIMSGFPHLLSDLNAASQVEYSALEKPALETIARVTPLLSAWAEE